MNNSHNNNSIFAQEDLIIHLLANKNYVGSATFLNGYKRFFKGQSHIDDMVLDLVSSIIHTDYKTASEICVHTVPYLKDGTFIKLRDVFAEHSKGTSDFKNFLEPIREHKWPYLNNNDIHLPDLIDVVDMHMLRFSRLWDLANYISPKAEFGISYAFYNAHDKNSVTKNLNQAALYGMKNALHSIELQTDPYYPQYHLQFTVAEVTSTEHPIPNKYMRERLAKLSAKPPIF